VCVCVWPTTLQWPLEFNAPDGVCTEGRYNIHYNKWPAESHQDSRKRFDSACYPINIIIIYYRYLESVYCTSASFDVMKILLKIWYYWTVFHFSFIIFFSVSFPRFINGDTAEACASEWRKSNHIFFLNSHICF